MTDTQTTPQEGTTPAKICKKCNASIPKYAESCPNCGANLKPVYKKGWFWVLIVLLVLLVGIGGCSAACSKAVLDSTNTLSTEDGNAPSAKSSSEGADAQDSSSSSAAAKYSITDEQLVDKGYGMYSITGTFTNTSGKQYSYVQVEYVLKDASGAQIGTGFANTNNLADGTPWKFEAYCSNSTDEAPASFELSDVTGW